MLTWGGGRFWQLGHGDASQDETEPRRVAGLAGMAQARRCCNCFSILVVDLSSSRDTPAPVLVLCNALLDMSALLRHAGMIQEHTLPSMPIASEGANFNSVPPLLVSAPLRRLVLFAACSLRSEARTLWRCWLTRGASRCGA